MSGHFKNIVKGSLLTTCVVFVLSSSLKAQFLMDMVDTTTAMGKGMLSMYRKFDGIRISGYIQPQFQVAEEKGVKTFEGGNFLPKVNNRFMFRRSRVRIDYVHFGQEKIPTVQVVFQFDATERAFTMRDVWGRVSENNLKLFSGTIGMFARPFGYEVNLSSGDRETPERGRMSQLLMKGERDLGVMLSLDNRNLDSRFKSLVAHIGLFNGQGINATQEFDNYKDLIARIAVKPLDISKNISISAGASLLNGGMLQNTKYVYATSAQKKVQLDSSSSNLDGKAPRKYYGADVQVKFKNKAKYTTELRGEMITGTQTGTDISSETPVALLTGYQGLYVRKFNGAYFYLLQNLGSPKHQLAVKYDWYDPNTNVSKKEISAANGFTEADVKYSTLDIGYNFYMTPNIKLMLHYSMPKNEHTAIAGLDKDVKDNVLTTRLQFRF